MAKLRSGVMPPRRIPRPPQEQIDGFISYVEGEFERMDKQAKPGPGHVAARRLNKADSLKPTVLGFLLNGMRKMLPMDTTQVRDRGKALEIRNTYAEIASANAARSAR